MEGVVREGERQFGPAVEKKKKENSSLESKKQKYKVDFQGSFILLCFLFEFGSHTGGSAAQL